MFLQSGSPPRLPPTKLQSSASSPAARGQQPPSQHSPTVRRGRWDGRRLKFRDEFSISENLHSSTILASNPGLPRNFFSQPWKKSLRKKLRGRPGFEATTIPCFEL